MCLLCYSLRITSPDSQRNPRGTFLWKDTCLRVREEKAEHGAGTPPRSCTEQTGFWITNAPRVWARTQILLIAAPFPTDVCSEPLACVCLLSSSLCQLIEYRVRCIGSLTGTPHNPMGWLLSLNQGNTELRRQQSQFSRTSDALLPLTPSAASFSGRRRLCVCTDPRCSQQRLTYWAFYQYRATWLCTPASTWLCVWVIGCCMVPVQNKHRRRRGKPRHYVESKRDVLGHLLLPTPSGEGQHVVSPCFRESFYARYRGVPSRSSQETGRKTTT